MNPLGVKMSTIFESLSLLLLVLCIPTEAVDEQKINLPDAVPGLYPIELYIPIVDDVEDKSIDPEFEAILYIFAL